MELLTIALFIVVFAFMVWSSHFVAIHLNKSYQLGGTFAVILITICFTIFQWPLLLLCYFLPKIAPPKEKPSNSEEGK